FGGRLPDGDSGKPKAKAGAPQGGLRGPVGSRHAAVRGAAVKARAPAHPGPRDLVIPEVFTPLPNVAMHVIQPHLVRRIRSHFRRAIQERPLVRLAEWNIAVAVRLLR